MSTALVVSASPTEEKIHLYYNATSRNLALQLKNGASNGEDEPKVYASQTGDQAGYIVKSSDLGSCTFLGMNFVVGITEPTSCATTTNNVSIVSPVYRTLTTTESANKAVAICSSGTHAWAYYLKGADALSLKIYEHKFADFSTDSVGDNDKVIQGSSLAAYYNPEDKKRYVIFQGKDGKELYEYSIDSEGNESTTKLKETSGAGSLTPMAVVYNDKKVYLYYANTSNEIERIKKEGGHWKSSMNLSKKIDKAYQLSVAWNDKIPHVFYVPHGSTTFSHLRDTKATS